MTRTLACISALLLALLPATGASAQTDDIPAVTYPEIPFYRIAPEDYVPAGWAIETKVLGDLDEDGKKDLAMVLRCQDKANTIPGNGETLNTNPRILVVALYDGTGYNLIIDNHDLIPRPTDPALDDFFDATDDGLTIEDGALKVSLNLFSGMGGWTMGRRTYTFLWQNDTLELSRYDLDETDRQSGATKTLAVDYDHETIQISTGNIAEDDVTTQETPLPSQDTPVLDNIGDGMDFTPLTGL